MSWFNRCPNQTRVLRGARATLSSTHFMGYKPEIHAHDWHVTAWTEAPGDVRTLEYSLKEVLKPMQGGLLNTRVPSGSAEHLAMYVHEHVGGLCCVEVEREGKYLARYEAPPRPGDWDR